MANDYKKTVTSTIGAGMKSLFGGQGRTYYILEHKVSSQFHKAGESQEIIVDQIELGRDSRCQVRFDESFSTVSRRHAAIVRSGNGWKLVQLSTTNKTFLNGVPIEKEWYLQNGDEIQLSVNGPKLGFIIPQGNKSTVNTIGLSRRLSLFRQQALRPYKTAITFLAILLLLAIAAGVFFTVRGNNVNRELRQTLIQDSIQFHQRMDSMTSVMGVMKQNFDADINKLKIIRPRPIHDTIVIIRPPKDTSDTVSEIGYTSWVYYIQTIGYTIEMDGEEMYFELGETVDYNDMEVEVDGWIATGFLLNNGKLVTARHCIEGWYYIQCFTRSKWQLILNCYASKGAKVNAVFVAVSPSGQRMKFTSNEVMCNRGGDHPFTLGDDVVTLAGNESFDSRDFAWFNTNLKGGLDYAPELSEKLPLDTKLEIYGFPHGWGVKSATQVSPIKGSGVVAKEGLENGIILLGGATFESGHSGSPALYRDKDGKYTVVGIVSAKSAQQSYGFIVPISRVK